LLLPINTSVIAINYGNRMSTKGWPVHTAFLSISIVAQDARYQLPLYAITLAAVPLLLGARRVTTKHPISTDPHPGSA
ncbi:hypothetical protein G4Q78_11780, partial [Stenotrophomonas maltophilia]|nr:hypothetical protein [Stenotrophomonas maltophilia]MBC9093476.1 hypothetical protein [Stenotrophomonas maltophilia]